MHVHVPVLTYKYFE